MVSSSASGAAWASSRTFVADEPGSRWAARHWSVSRLRATVNRYARGSACPGVDLVQMPPGPQQGFLNYVPCLVAVIDVAQRKGKEGAGVLIVQGGHQLLVGGHLRALLFRVLGRGIPQYTLPHRNRFTPVRPWAATRGRWAPREPSGRFQRVRFPACQVETCIRPGGGSPAPAWPARKQRASGSARRSSALPLDSRQGENHVIPTSFPFPASCDRRRRNRGSGLRRARAGRRNQSDAGSALSLTSHVGPDPGARPSRCPTDSARGPRVHRRPDLQHRHRDRPQHPQGSGDRRPGGPASGRRPRTAVPA